MKRLRRVNCMVSVLEYLLRSAERCPDKAAIRMGESVYSFEKLRSDCAKMADSIPGELKNQPVGVFVERSAESLMMFLSVLYSGNYYVPLDPQMPKEKLLSILSDTKMTVVLGENCNKELVSELGFEGLFLTPEDMGDNEREPACINADDPVYMVYTSGSTGKPKGVLKSHKAVISFIESYMGTFDFSEDEVIGNQTPFFFDASAKDLYLMLASSATLEIIPSQLFAMPPKLVEYLNDKKITMISWVPTALSIVSQLKAFSAVKPQYLKKVFFVGEVMPVKHLNYWRSELPGLMYVNLYGASELAGICCYYIVKGEFENGDTLPIGRALSNCNVFLARNGSAVTGDEVGEICVSSDALALEYYNDPEKTAERFVQMTLDGKTVRCYKTGDLARYDANGELVFVSRCDHQIKHMGYRIELGDIEANVNTLPQVTACCCVYDKDKDKIILFYSGDTQERELLVTLKQKLPRYMLPNKARRMQSLPLNANGKTDRVSLQKMI